MKDIAFRILFYRNTFIKDVIKMLGNQCNAQMGICPEFFALHMREHVFFPLSAVSGISNAQS